MAGARTQAPALRPLDVRATSVLMRCTSQDTDMRLTDFTDYSLRVMLYLAVRDHGLSTIQEISDAYGVSKNHLMKVVQLLGELGWVDTVRGRNGGLRLADGARQLRIGEIVRATESDFALVACLGAEDRKQCVIEPHCRLKGVFVAAREAFLRELDRHTIAELCAPAAPLARSLGLIPVAAGADAVDADA
jgi:Rrf2 family transcriptional regulator, nitric oxide-sensitive transcriptional repressor